MAKNTSIQLGDYFINQQVSSGKFSSASEVLRAALILFEEKTQKVELINELKKGEQSGFVQNFDRDKFLKSIHHKHVSK